MDSNIKKILVVCGIVIVTSACFFFWYGKKYQARANKKYRDSVEVVNKKLLNTIKLKDTTIFKLNSKYLTALQQLKDKKVQYVLINQKYAKMDSVVNAMPFDDQVRYLSEWLPKDSLSASNNPKR